MKLRQVWGQTAGVTLGSAALIMAVASAAYAQANQSAGQTTSQTADQMASQMTSQMVSQTVDQSDEIASPPLPTSISTPFYPELSGILDLYSDADAIPSVGHLRPRHVEGLTDDSVNWLTSVSLPLYISPGG